MINTKDIDEIARMFEWAQDPDFILQKIGKTRQDLKKLESDDEIAQCLDTRRESIISVPFHFEHDDQTIIDYCTEQLTPIFEDLVRSVWDAVPYGYSATRIIYKKGANGGVDGISEIVSMPTDWFTFNRVHGWMNNLMKANIPLTDLEKNYTHFFTVRNKTWNNPYGEALLSRAYWAWFFKHNLWGFWMQYLERFGTPFIIGKGADTEALFNGLMRAVQDAVIAIPESDDVQIAGVTGNVGTSFEGANDALNTRIQKLILGQTLTSQVGKVGSFAAARVHDNVRKDKRNADIRLVSATVQKIMTALVSLKFGLETKPPKFVMEDGLGLEKERADRDKVLSDLGVKFSPEYINRVYDFEDNEITIDKATVAPTPTKMSAKFSANGNVAGGRDSHKPLKNPITDELIQSAIRSAKNPEDLEFRLAELMRDVDIGEFSQTLERALFAADVLGYIDA